MKLTVIRGDITKVYADVIVNAANRNLRGGGGVDGAIHKAAGPSLLPWETWMYPFGTEVGCPVVTPAFDLPARHIVHVPGPDVRWLHELAAPGHGARYAQGGAWALNQWRQADERLWNAYSRSLVLAGTLAARSITFPSLSTGIFAFPLDRAVPLAVSALRESADRAPSIGVASIVAFDEATYEAFKAEVG